MTGTLPVGRGGRGPPADDAGLAIRTLGGLEVSLGGATVPSFRARSAEALLVYLASHDRPLPRDQLAEFLWPERPQEVSRTNLRSALHRLRLKLGAALSVTRSAAGLVGGCWVDSLQLEADMREGRFEQAMSHYRGDFLSGFYLDDSPAFENWMLSEQERYRSLAVAACGTLLTHEHDEGHLAEAIDWARLLLRIDAIHEPTHRILMRLLVGRGERTAALAQFDACRRALEEHLGVEPSPETLALVGEIRAGTFEPSVQQVALHPRREGLTSDASSPLVGREIEIDRAIRLLSDIDCRILSITGPGGIGKTRVALDVAERVTGLFAQGAAVVPLAAVEEAELIWAALAQALFPGPAPTGRLERDVKDFLRGKELLLLLDNFEHLSGAAPVLLELLREAPRIKLLVTSRDRLRLTEEWILRLGGLGERAIELFEHRALRADPSFDAASQRDGMLAVCEAVDSLPLAVEMAASWVHVMDCEAIAAEVRRDASFLRTGFMDAPGRHRSMAATFDHSWRLLPPELRTCLARLSVFRGGFSPGEAAAVAGAAITALRSLTDTSLLNTEVGGRLGLHELIRQQAASRLADSGEAETIHTLHFEAFAGLAEEFKQHFFGAGQLEWQRRLILERDNIRSALAWALERRHRPERIAAMLDALGWHWRLAFAVEEGTTWLERGLQLEGLSPDRRARLLYHLGHYAWMQYDWSTAENRLGSSIELWESLGESGRHGKAVAQLSLALTCLWQKDPAGAEVLLRAAGPVVAASGDRWFTALCDGRWAGLHTVMGRSAEARKAADRCLSTYRALGNPWGLGLDLYNAAWIETQLPDGDLERARRYGVEAVAVLESIGFVFGAGGALEVLAAVVYRLGNRAEAQAYLDRALEIHGYLGIEPLTHKVEELPWSRRR